MEAAVVDQTPPPSRLTRGEAKQIFIRWEKLRLIYNLVMGLILLAAFAIYAAPDWPSLEVWLGYLGLCAVGGVIANFCFFAAPVAEIYLAWLGWRTRWSTVLLFTGGVIVTCGLAVMWFIFLGISVFMFSG
ncbi:MAG: hypothetical protein AAGG38_02880 [Planctomycetota bacterium]